MRNCLDKVYLACGVIAAASLAGIFAIVIAQIAARFFNVNIPSSDDISGYLVAWTTFMGLSYAMSKDDHIRVDLFVNMLPANLRFRVAVGVGFVGFAMMSLFFYFVFLVVYEAYEFGDRTSGHVSFPLWLVQAPYLIGIFFLIVSVLDRFMTGLLFDKGGK